VARHREADSPAVGGQAVGRILMERVDGAGVAEAVDVDRPRESTVGKAGRIRAFIRFRDDLSVRPAVGSSLPRH